MQWVDTIVKFIAYTVIFPVVLLGFAAGWLTIMLLGMIIFIGFPVAGFILDSLRWMTNNFRSKVPENELNDVRLKKAVRALIYILQTASNIEPEPVARSYEPIV